jgi:hypothetical protein
MANSVIRRIRSYPGRVVMRPLEKFHFPRIHTMEKEICMSRINSRDRYVRVAAGVAAMLSALTVSAQSRPLGPQVPDTDQRGQTVTPRPPVKSSYDPKTSIVRDHRKPR